MVDDSISRDGAGCLDGRRGVWLHGNGTCSEVTFVIGVGLRCMLFQITVGPAAAGDGYGYGGIDVGPAADGDGCSGSNADGVGRE